MSFVNTFHHLLNHPLNKKNKASAIWRFFKWQLGSRLVPGDIIFNWINNAKIAARAGEKGVTGNVYCGLHEFSEMFFLLHVLRKDDLFVDIGANVGSYTVLASKAVGAKVLCFEPVPTTYERLVTNIRLNDAGKRVVSLNMALGEVSGELCFTSDKNTSNHVITDRVDDVNTIKVPVSTLDSELTDSPFLIKIDVEGYETPVIEGAKQALADKQLCAVIMELNGSGRRYGFDESKILSMMLDLEFQPCEYRPFERQLIALNGKNLNAGNTIFVRDKERVLRRIKDADTFRVFSQISMTDSIAHDRRERGDRREGAIKICAYVDLL